MFAVLIVGKKSPNSSKVVLTACPTSGKNRRSLCGSKMKVDTVSEMKLSLQESFRKQVCCDGGGAFAGGGFVCPQKEEAKRRNGIRRTPAKSFI